MKRFAIPVMILAIACSGCISAKAIDHDELAHRYNKPNPRTIGPTFKYMGTWRGMHFVKIDDGLSSLGSSEAVAVPADQWKIDHPMPLTNNAKEWRTLSFWDIHGITYEQWAKQLPHAPAHHHRPGEIVIDMIDPLHPWPTPTDQPVIPGEPDDWYQRMQKQADEPLDPKAILEVGPPLPAIEPPAIIARPLPVK